MFHLVICSDFFYLTTQAIVIVKHKSINSLSEILAASSLKRSLYQSERNRTR